MKAQHITGIGETSNMKTTTVFKHAAIQKKAPALFKGGAEHVLFFGGSRRLMRRYQADGARNRNSGGIYGIG
jgi:hypothetical protein